MSSRDDYPAGVPNWVSCLADDVPATTAFYGALFGWTYAVAPDGSYAVAHRNGRQVAGIGTRAAASPDAECAWVTSVRVADTAALAHQVSAAGGAVLAADLDMSPAGRITVFTDPTGALLTGWQAGDRNGAELVNEPGAWAMSVLQTPDPERAAGFFGTVFGWTVESFGPVELFRLAGYVGGEPQQPVPRDVVAAMMPGTPAGWAVDFWIDDADAGAAAAVEHGGAVVAPVVEHGNFRRAVLRDPGGAVFTVSQLIPY